MSQTQFHLLMKVVNVHRLTDDEVHVEATLGRDGLSFKLYTAANDVPRVNDDILVTITTPAPETLP